MLSYGVTIYYNGGALNNMFVLSGIALLLLLGKKAANNELGEKFIMKRCFFADLSYFIYLSHAVLISTINVHQLVISKVLNLFPYCDILDALDYILYPLLFFIKNVSLFSSQILKAIAVQGVWAVVLILLSRAFYLYSIKKVTVQGG